MRQVHHLEQGSPEWLAHRATPGMFNASELKTIMGLDKKTGRNELLYMKSTGDVKQFSDYVQKNVIDKGHENEALARPLAESIIDDDLSALVMTDLIDGVLLSASLDGITQGKDITFEHKSLNADLAAALDAGILPEEYKPQCEAGLMVSGATRCLFMASSDGDMETARHIWYESDPALRPRIIASCKQFAEDLANYKHVEVVEQPKAQVSIELPALFIQAKGQITDSNMVAYGEALKTKLAEVRAIALVTDQDFSDAKAAAAMFRDQRTKLQAAKDAMLSQTMTIGEAARMIDAWSEDLRLTALQLEKDVERKDREKKAAIISAGAGEFTAHVAALNVRLGGSYGVHFASPNLAEAIKGKRTYTSMTASVNAAVAAAKVDASLVADRIQENRDLLKGDAHDFMFLFPDFQHVCTKQREDFAAMLFQRQTQEEQRLEAERERIRQQEAVKADAQAKAQAAQEARDNDQRAKADAGTTMPACVQTTAAPDAGFMPVEVSAGNAASAASSPPNTTYAVCEQHTETMIDDFISLLACSAVEKKAIRANIVKWEKYRIARLMQETA